MPTVWQTGQVLFHRDRRLCRADRIAARTLFKVLQASSGTPARHSSSITLATLMKLLLRVQLLKQCAVKRRWIFSGCKSHPATRSLQPVAIGAAVEVTKPPEPSMQRVAQATPRAGRP